MTIQEKIDQAKREGYDDQRAVEARMKAIQARKLEIGQEHQALELEAQQLQTEFGKRYERRLAQIEAWEGQLTDDERNRSA